MTLSDIIDKLNDNTLTLSGNGTRQISRIASPENADTESLCVVWDPKVLPSLPPEIPIVAPKDFFTPNRDGITSLNPRALLPKLLALFAQTKPQPRGIHPSAVISPNAQISPTAYVGPCAYVGEGCTVGNNTIIEPNATLLVNVRVGADCLIHSGAVLGADGFGFERTPDGLVKIPQLGGVVIGDNVEIGACTTIDRGTMGNTVIGPGTKIDNQVQIGHNVQTGHNCILCSMSGIGGSTILGDNVTLSIQAGITDHVHIGSGTIIAGRSGVTNDLPEGSIVSGFPARPHNKAKRALVLAADLPELYKRVRVLERKLEALQKL